MELSNVKLGTRLGIGFGIVLLMAVIIAVSGYWGVQSLPGVVGKMLKTDARIAKNAALARTNVLGLRRFEKDLYLNLGNKEKEEGYLKKWKEQHEHLLNRITDLEKAADHDKDREAIKGMKDEATAYHSGFNKVYTMIQAGQVKTPQEGNSAINEFKEVIHKLEQKAKNLADEGNKRMDAVEGLMKTTANQTALIMTVLALLAIMVGVGLSVFLVRSITNVISGLNDGADLVASPAE